MVNDQRQEGEWSRDKERKGSPFLSLDTKGTVESVPEKGPQEEEKHV